MALLAGESITMAYQIDGGPLEQEPIVLTGDLLSGEAMDFIFSKMESVQTGNWYDFTVFVEYSDDSRAWNDTVSRSVGIFAPPALDLGPDMQVITDLDFTLDAGPGYISYLWQDGSTGSEYTSSQEGWVGLEVSDASGCTCP